MMQPISVFVPLIHEEYIGGVFANLDDALKAYPTCSNGIDEYVLGSTERIRSWTDKGTVWWENGRDIRWDKKL